jgi:hypothetical protein
MRWWCLLALLLSGCPETVGCPEGQVFDMRGQCIAIPDAGPPRDAGRDGA